MKKIVSLLLLITSFVTVRAQEKIKLPDINRSDAESAINAKKTGDDKQNFSSILNALGKFSSQNESTIQFKPTIYGIVSLFNPKIKEDEKFSNATFIRNFQLNLGVTPSDESIFKVNDFQSGFTYAIFNNKKLSQEDYKHLKESVDFRDQTNLNAALMKFAAKNMNTPEAKIAANFATKGITEDNIKDMPADLLTFLKIELNIKDQQELINFSEGAKKLFKSMTRELAKKPLLTVEYNGNYSFETKGWSGFTFTPFNYIKYFNRSSLKSPNLNLKLSYSIGKDTATKEALKRNVYVGEAGINFPIGVNEKTEKPWFEIKPGIKYTYVANRVYIDEKKSQINPTVTFRIRINDDFYLPLVMEYNTEDPELLGFLSVQFSLN